MWCSQCTASCDMWFTELLWSCWRPEAAQRPELCTGNLKVTYYFSVVVTLSPFCSVCTCPYSPQWKAVRIWFWSSAWTAERTQLPGIHAPVTGKITELCCSLSRRLRNGWKLFRSWVEKLSCCYHFFSWIIKTHFSWDWLENEGDTFHKITNKQKKLLCKPSCVK